MPTKLVQSAVTAASLSLAIFSLSCLPASANNHLNCQAYAQSVINQVNENNKFGCGFSGAQWSPDFNFHFNWCNQGTTRIHHLGEQDNFRKAKLRECKLTKPGSGMRPANAYNEEQCDNYAKQMVGNAKINVTRSCGINDPRLHQNYQAHWDWCFNGRTKQQVRATLDEVVASIERCGQNVKTYEPANFRGTPLDGCFAPGSGSNACGKPVADWFCKDRGHIKSQNFKTNGTDFTVYSWCLDMNAAKKQQFIDQGGTCHCSNDTNSCGYFEFITCSGQK